MSYKYHSEFESMRLAMDIIVSINSKIGGLESKISTIDAVLNKQRYVQKNMSFVIDGTTFNLCEATQSGTETKRGSEMIMLGVKKMLNSGIDGLEKELVIAKDRLALGAEVVRGGV